MSIYQSRLEQLQWCLYSELGCRLINLWFPHDPDRRSAGHDALTFYLSKQHTVKDVGAVVFRMFEIELIPLNWNQFRTRSDLRKAAFPGIFVCFKLGLLASTFTLDLPDPLMVTDPSEQSIEHILDHVWAIIKRIIRMPEFSTLGMRLRNRRYSIRAPSNDDLDSAVHYEAILRTINSQFIRWSQLELAVGRRYVR